MMTKMLVVITAIIRESMIKTIKMSTGKEFGW